MKNPSLFTNEKGFFFPYMMFVAILVLMIVLANIAIYKNNLEFTMLEQEQIKISTLVQMGTAKCKADFIQNPPSDTTGHIEYNFPYGKVQINFTQINSYEYNLKLFIKTDHSGKFATTETLTINESLP